MGAPTWPPYPQRSGRPGKAVAPSTSVGAGPDMAPIPPTLGTPRQSRGALDIRPHGPHTPNARDAPAKPWRPRHPWARDRHLRGPEMAPIPPTLGTPRQSRGALD